MAKTTHIICILDRSGSMSMQAPEVITNFNNFLKEQKSVEGKAKLSLVLFDDHYEIVHDKVNIKDVPKLTSDVYYTRGMTAMNDAIGRTLSRLEDKKNAIVMIHTDGYENASKEWTYDTVKQKVKQLKKKWEFIFVGGDIDAKQVGNNLGIMNTMQVTNDSIGNAHSYAMFANTTTAYRSGGVEASTVAYNDTLAEVDNSDASTSVFESVNIANTNPWQTPDLSNTKVTDETIDTLKKLIPESK